jgi:hypothetical protein
MASPEKRFGTEAADDRLEANGRQLKGTLTYGIDRPDKVLGKRGNAHFPKSSDG